MTIKNLRVLIQSSAPGELTNWVYPICYALQETPHSISITVALSPCQFSSGYEKQVAIAFPNVDNVLLPNQTIKLIFKSFLSSAPKNDYYDFVFYLGGDPFYTKRLAKYYNCSSVGYAEFDLKKSFDLFFLKKMSFDLMASKIAYEQSTKTNDQIEKNYLLFLPGARKNHYKNILPIYVDTLKCLKRISPNLKVALLLSNFMNEKELHSLKKMADLNGFDYVFQDSFLAISNSFAVVTIPGTNTAEISYLQVPMFVILPLNKPNVLIFKGILHYIFKIPIIGYALKILLILIILIKKPFFSLPNIILNKPVVPEYIAYIQPQKLAIKIMNFLENENLLKIKRHLNYFKPTKSVATNIIDSVLKNL